MSINEVAKGILLEQTCDNCNHLDKTKLYKVQCWSSQITKNGTLKYLFKKTWRKISVDNTCDEWESMYE